MSSSSVKEALLLSLAVPILVYAFSAGPPQAHTGGFGEPTCVECHVGIALNGGPGSVTISVDAPSGYASGVTYPVTVTVSDPNQRRWGFESSARSQGGSQAGTLIRGGDGFTQLLLDFGGIQYIAHTTSGTRAGTTSGVSFNFTWRAPDVSTGPVIFNVAANAANNSGTETGDRIYSNSLTLQPQAPAGPAPSVVNDTDMMNNASYRLAASSVAPGTIVAIFGSNLTDGSSCLQPTCFPTIDSNGQLNTTLAGAQVLVNGTPAPILYAAPFQVGIQVPTELTGGTATVQVKVGAQTSTSRTLFLEPTAPGIFTVNAQGTGAASITHVNGSAVLPANPARPGETVILWATGLGQVSPAVATGRLPTGESRTVNSVTVTIDGIPVIPDFSGLSGCCAGLNQVNVRVPSSARTGNDIPVVLSTGGKQSQTATMAIAAP